MIIIDGYPIDASLSETHTYEADVTSYPVESGATITDNVRPKPITVELECIVSDAPLAVVLQARRQKDLADPAFADSPSTEALDRMVAIRDEREPVTIETGLKVYQNMIMTSFVTTLDKDTGKALKFTASFVQITIVSNIRARVRVSSPGVPSSKNKTSGAPVVVAHVPDADHRNITTLSGRAASWNDEKGRYEYAADEGSDGGSPVPARDLGDYTQYSNHATPVPPGGLVADPSELGPDGKPVNSTYFDQQDDQWKNTDGSPVTQQQLSAKQDPTSPKAQDDAAQAWWAKQHNLSRGLDANGNRLPGN